MCNTCIACQRVMGCLGCGTIVLRRSVYIDCTSLLILLALLMIVGASQAMLRRHVILVAVARH